MAVRPKCPLCGKDLKHPYATMEIGGKLIDVLVEKQVSYWMHNPRFPQEDILVIAHRSCFDKVKKIFPEFDRPTQDKMDVPMIEAGIPVLLSLQEFKKRGIL